MGEPGFPLMTIKDFSEKTQITVSAIRYYDKLGLFHGLSRNSSGYREFTDKEITWALFINRLKDTGMPIKDISGPDLFYNELYSPVFVHSFFTVGYWLPASHT